VSIPGPEGFLAGRPLMVVTLVALQIVATLCLTGLLSRRATPSGAVAAFPGDADGLVPR